MDKDTRSAIERATRDGGPLGVLVRLFLLGGTETHDDVARALPGSSVDALIANGVLEPGVSAALDIRPHSDGAADFLVVSDLDSATRPGPVRPDHVLGIGGASVSLARAVARNPVRRALDRSPPCLQALYRPPRPTARIRPPPTRPRPCSARPIATPRPRPGSTPSRRPRPARPPGPDR